MLSQASQRSSCQAREHAVAGITELNLTVERLPGFYRQRDNRMYSTLSFITPVTLLRLPYSFAIALVWSAMVRLPCRMLLCKA